MCPIVDGSPVNATNTNSQLLDAVSDDTALGVLTVANTAPASGPTVTNIQREHNGAASFSGRTPGGAFDELPTWTNNDVGLSTDNLKARADSLTAKFNATTGHKHTGAAGDAPVIPSGSIGVVPLRGFIAQAIDQIGATGTSTNVSAAMSGKTPSSGTLVTGVVVTFPVNKLVIRQASGASADDAYTDTLGNVVYGRLTEAASVWTLSYFVLLSSVETAYSFASPSDVRWYYQELFNPLSTLAPPPVYSEFSSVPSDNATSDVITANTTQQGKTQLASTAAADVGSAGAVGTTNATVSNADHVHRGVASFSKSGASLLYGGVTISAGAGLSLSQVGQDVAISSTGGAGGGLNYITNGVFETDTSGWAAYADAAGAQPVNGTGGAPTVTITRTTSSPLRGTGSGLLTKDAANRQGEGVSYDFTIDAADVAKPIQIAGSYAIASGIYSGGTSSTDSDVTCYIYDVTNAQVIQPAGFKLDGSVIGQTYKLSGTFQSNAGSTSYRLILHVATTSAVAYTLKFDAVSVGPNVISSGYAGGDWTAYTPITAGLGTLGAVDVTARRSGDSLEVRARITTGTTTGTTASFSLPVGLSADLTKLLNQTIVGSGSTQNASARVFYILSGGALTDLRVGSGSSNSLSTQAGSFFSNTEVLSFYCRVPISGWSSNTVVSSDTDTRIVVAKYTTPAGTLSGAVNDLRYTASVIDTHAAYNTSTGVYTVPVAGKYLVNAKVFVDATYATGNATEIYVLQNGTIQDGGSSKAGGAIGQQQAQVTAVLDCLAGALIKTQSLAQGTTPTFNASTVYASLLIERISGPSQIASSETVALHYTNTSGTTLTNVTNTVIPFSTKDYDTHGAFVTDTFTANASGVYSVFARASILHASASPISSFMMIYKNGVQTYTGPRNSIAAAASRAGDAHGIFVSDCIRLIAGDTIKIFGFCDNGANRSLTITSGENTLAITRIGN